MSKEKKNYNGEGSVYYSDKLERWIGQFTDFTTGKRKSIYDRDEKKCRQKLRKAISQSENGQYIDKSKVTINDLGKEIIELKYKANIIGDCAYLRYNETLKTIEKSNLNNVIIQKTTRNQIQDFMNSLVNRSNSCIIKINTFLGQIFREATKRNIINYNPMLDITRPKSNKPDRKITALTIEEHRKFISALSGEKYKNIFMIAINTGLRCGEILALTPADIDFKNNCIHVTKTISRDINDKAVLKNSTKTYAGTRDFPIDEQLKAILKNSIKTMKLNSNNLIFTLDNCKLISVSSLNSRFKRICKDLGFSGKQYNFHMLRHTFATRCIEAGMPSHVLQKLLGHTDVSTTINTYTTIFNKYKDEELKKVIDYKQKNKLM